MSTVVIAGESLPSVRILAVSLAAEGFDVVLVSSPDELAATVRRSVDLVILDHLEPTDLYRLNPRQHGFSGRLLLLAENDSEPVPGLLNPDRVVRKPFHLDDVRRYVYEMLVLMSR